MNRIRDCVTVQNMDDSAPSLNTIDCTATGQNFFKKERDLSNSRSQAVVSNKSLEKTRSGIINEKEEVTEDSLVDKSNIELLQADVNKIS